MMIKELHGATNLNTPIIGAISRYFRAYNAGKKIDLDKLVADSAEITTAASELTGKFPYLICSNIEAILKYSKPQDINIAFNDLKILGEQTGKDYTHNMNAMIYLEKLAGPWKLTVKKIDKKSDIKPYNIEAKIFIPRILSENKRSEIKKLLHKEHDELFHPRSHIIQDDGRLKYHGYVTGYEDKLLISKTPTLIVRKTWKNLDENKILDFYINMLGYGKPKYIDDEKDWDHMRMTVNMRKYFDDDDKNYVLTAKYVMPVNASLITKYRELKRKGEE